MLDKHLSLWYRIVHNFSKLTALIKQKILWTQIPDLVLRFSIFLSTNAFSAQQSSNALFNTPEFIIHLKINVNAPIWNQ